MKELPDRLEVPILLKMGDNVSTDEILAGGSRVLPYRSNLPEISKFCFEIIDERYYERSMELKNQSGHMLVGGYNYGQGSSREHAALAPRYLGLRVVLVKDFARIHWQNLVNFGVLPITFVHSKDYDKLKQEDIIEFSNLRQKIKQSNQFDIHLKRTGESIQVEHRSEEHTSELQSRGQ